MMLREIREASGMTQRQAALGLNLSPTVYNRYENGIREPPNALLPVIADFFGVTVDQLLGRQVEEDPWELRERLRRDPDMRILFDAASKASPEHIRIAANLLKQLEPAEEDAE